MVTDNPISGQFSDEEPSDSAIPSTAPNPDKPISLENELNGSTNITLTILNETGAVVHNGTYLVDDYRYDAYNLRSADPDGVETFTVRASTQSGSDETRVSTSECSGTAQVEITAEDGVRVFSSIC